MSRPRARAASILVSTADRAPVVLRPDLQVEDVDRDLRFFGDADRERELLVLLEAFAADVRRVVAAVRSGDLRHLDDLVGVLGAAAFEPRHKAPRAFCIERATSCFMRSSSAGVAARGLYPMTTRRTCSRRHCEITLIEMP